MDVCVAVEGAVGWEAGNLLHRGCEAFLPDNGGYVCVIERLRGRRGCPVCARGAVGYGAVSSGEKGEKEEKGQDSDTVAHRCATGKQGAKVVLHPSGWISGDVRDFDFSTVVGGAGFDGTLREYAVVDDERAVSAEGYVPLLRHTLSLELESGSTESLMLHRLSAEDAASLFTAGATAWHAIRFALDGKLDGSLLPWSGEWTSKRLEGQWALTQGTGGVSCFAIQILHALGATVISTSSSDAKLAIAKSIGAAHTINYAKTPDWHEEVMKITCGRGVDHVIDVGGTGTLLKSLKSTRQGGLVSMLGVLAKAESLEAEIVGQVVFRALTGKYMSPAL